MQILLIAVGWLIFVYIHAFLVYVNIFVEDRSKKVSWTPTSIMLLAYFNYICRMPKNVVLFTAQGRKFGCWGKGPGVKPPPRVELLVTWNSTGWRCEKRSLELVDFFLIESFKGKHVAGFWIWPFASNDEAGFNELWKHMGKGCCAWHEHGKTIQPAQFVY